MILLVGQVPRAFRGREAWQELDYARGLRRYRESGVGGRQRRAHPRAHRRGVLARALGQAWAGRARAARRTCSPRRPTSPTALASSPRGWHRAAADLERAARAARRRRAPARRRRRGRLDGETSRDVQRVLRGERASGRVRVPLPGLRRQPLAELRRRARRRDGRGDRGRLRDADLVLAIGGRLGEVPTRRYTLLEPPRPAPDARPRPSGPRASSAASTSPTLAIVATLTEFAAGAARARARRAALARVDGGRARRLRGEPRATSRWRATSTSARSWRSSARGFPGTRCRRAAPATSPSGRIASPSSRSSARSSCPRERLDGLRAPGRGRRAADPPRARRRLLHGRRRLRDELARARDRGAVRRCRSSCSS